MTYKTMTDAQLLTAYRDALERSGSVVPEIIPEAMFAFQDYTRAEREYLVEVWSDPRLEIDSERMRRIAAIAWSLIEAQGAMKH